MSRSKERPRIFNTDRRIRLGIWGLGRGITFLNTCRFLNINVVAGCDYNDHMRTSFQSICPGAFVTADEDEFLSQDFDAVLVATFCPAHGPHAIKCLQAGKHVLSEVTSFFNLAEGVQLVEEVRKRKLVYNLAENYPFSAANMWLASRWREGLFGEMMYAEYEYVHECRMLSYTYIDDTPVRPGHTVHSWRSWLSNHYYCTHSLGPVMVVTGTRPVEVEAFRSSQRIAGYLPTKIDKGMAPSLIRMSNGGVVRNLMGAGTNDSHQQRVWGTLGSYTIGDDGVKLRLGAAGKAPMMKVTPQWEGLGEFAQQTGHGGGDFWTLYYFAREILTGEKSPFDIYGSCDVTIPGIMALRSSLEGGKPMAVPDFRKKADRDRYRSDDWEQGRYDTKRGVFGGFVPKPGQKAANFSAVMKAMVLYAPMYRAYADWKKVESALADPTEMQPVAQQLLDNYSALCSAYKDARAIIKAHPRSDGARVLAEMLEVGEEKKALAPGFLVALKKDVAALRRKHGEHAADLGRFQASALLADQSPISAVAYPRNGLRFAPLPYNPSGWFNDIRGLYEGHEERDGLVYARCHVSRQAGPGKLKLDADGPFKVFVNQQEVVCDPNATNPMRPRSTVDVDWKKGRNEIVFALQTNKGAAWGFRASLVQG